MIRTLGLFALCALATAFSGCGDDGASAGGDAGSDVRDGGGTTASDGGPAPPAPPLRAPERPSPVAMEPCPASWTVREEEIGTWCDPGESAPGDCAPGEAHLPGGTGCVVVGSACPADGWPEGLPESVPIVFVRSGASGGDGSRARPFGTIAEALAVRAADAIIALATGEYREQVSITGTAVTLWGACARSTRIAPAGPTDSAVVIAQAPLVLRDVTVGPSSAAGVWALATLEATDVVLDRVSDHGIFVQAAEGTVSRSLIADVQPDASGASGRGAEVVSAGVLTMDEIEVRNVHETALAAFHAGTSLRVTRARLRDTRPSASTGVAGYGVVVAEGAALQIERTVLERNRTQTLLVDGVGSSIVASHIAVLGSQSEEATGSNGTGIAVINGATLTLRASSIRSANDTGVFCGGGAAITGTDVYVRSVARSPVGRGGTGAALVGCTAELDRIAIAEPAEAGLYVAGETTAALRDVHVDGGGTAAGIAIDGPLSAELIRARIESPRGYGLGVRGAETVVGVGDLVVADPEPSEIGIGGVGLIVQEGATAEVRVAAVTGASEGGVVVDAAALLLEDATIQASRGLPNGTFGRGLGVQLGARLTGRRLLVESNRDIALFAGGLGTTVDIEDLSATDNGSRGANVQDGATLSLTRAVVERSSDIGLLALGDGSRVEGVDVVVRGTAAVRCGAPPCIGGTAASSVAHAALSLERFALVDSALCGVQVARDAEVDLTSGAVTGNALGACVQVPGYDIGRLMREVRYSDNDVLLDSSDLPVPEPASP